jgi:hypothetical protein
VLIDRIPYSVPELPLLIRLSKLTSLGVGLAGPSLSSVGTANSDVAVVRGVSAVSALDVIEADSVMVPARLRVPVLTRFSREIGSSDMTRGLGFGIEAMSMAS